MKTIPSVLTDAEILAGLANGKGMDVALKALYGHYEFLTGFIKANGGRDDEAQDIFQEVLIAFTQIVQAGKFRGDSSIRTFLYALNRNMWLNELKKKGRARSRENQYEQLNDREEKTVAVAIESRESSKRLMTIMEELGSRCRQILQLYYFENRTMKEIQALLPYENEQVVRNKKYKCLKNLEEKIRNNPDLFRQLKTLLHE